MARFLLPLAIIAFHLVSLPTFCDQQQKFHLYAKRMIYLVNKAPNPPLRFYCEGYDYHVRTMTEGQVFSWGFHPSLFFSDVYTCQFWTCTGVRVKDGDKRLTESILFHQLVLFVIISLSGWGLLFFGVEVLHRRQEKQGRAQIFSPKTPPRQVPSKVSVDKKKHSSSPVPSEQSCTGENSIPVAHPNAKPFRTKGLEHYDLLAELLGNTMATGAYAPDSTVGPITTDDEDEMEALMHRMRKGKGLQGDTSSGSKGKRKSDDGQSCGRSHPSKMFLKAFNRLAENLQLRKAFVQLDPDMRRFWVETLE
ncbi:hypothetical protein RHSIM_Rhsim02G0048500 [Rhododendron simsii]|uniref:S-protein homolog n=1 Tax=Rhododendron simsii TaxID=118357 RepID=A0A834LV93_RHOSS|nr:hypothetical protein RHSIM_Rhsim02G0048500 [Rhododendron simsii]